MAGRGGPSPASRHRARNDLTIRRGRRTSTWPLRLKREAHARGALLAGGLRGRRILLEALQMRGDQLLVGGNRRRRCAGADGGRGRRLPFGLRRARWCAAPVVASVGFFGSARTTFGFTGVGFCSGTDLAGSGFGGVVPSSARAAPRLRASPAAGSARSAPGTASASRLGRRGVGLLHHGSRREIHRRRLRRRRDRRHVHHDRGQRDAGRWRLARTS